MKRFKVLALLFVFLVGFAPGPVLARQVKGTLKYRDGKTNDLRPIRYVDVTVIPLADDDEEKTTTTDGTGFFSVSIPNGAVPGGSTVRIEFRSINYAADVYLDLDGENEQMLWSREVVAPAGTGPVTVNANVSVANLSSHFNIADAILTGRIYIDGLRADDDDISQVDVQYPDTDWSNHDPYWCEITLSGPAMFGHGGETENGLVDHGIEDEVILHEFGHHITGDVSDHDSSGGDHTEATDNGVDFAWSEGFATFYAHAVARAYPSRVTMPRTIEKTPTFMDGTKFPAGSEGMTQSALWDLLDGVDLAKEPWDRVNGPAVGAEARIFAIWDCEIDEGELSSGKEIGRNILGFHDAWAKRQSSTHPELDRVLAEHGIEDHARQDYTVANVIPLKSSLEPGEKMNVIVRIWRKNSYYSSQNVKVKIWLGRNVVVGSGKYKFIQLQFVYNLGEYDMAFPALGFGTYDHYATKTIQVQAPYSQPVDSAFVVATVDSSDRFLEADEGNNRLVGPSVTLEDLFNNPDYDPWAGGSNSGRSSGDSQSLEDLNASIK